MDISWVILIIIIAVIFLLILFFYFMVWGISQGLRNKFGPEWIPFELQIKFNHNTIDFEDKKIIKYVLSDKESIEAVSQINYQITNKQVHNGHRSPFEFQESYWRKIDSNVYKFRQVKTDRLKAVFTSSNKELIYYK